MAGTKQTKWQLGEVASPRISGSVVVVVAKDIDYVSNANRLQNLSIYLPKTQENTNLVGGQVDTLPITGTKSEFPRIHVHVHGGAWRDPYLSSQSVEADVAHAFSASDSPIDMVIGINYTLSPFPTHPNLPYDPVKDNHSDPGREAVHPMHIRDVLSGFALLRRYGLSDGSYILSGHSCGACLAFQAVLVAPKHWGFEDLPAPPRPAALLGMNGLYDLMALVHGLGNSHLHLSEVYENLQGIAFGADQAKWPAASPALFDSKEIAQHVENGSGPPLVLVDQSTGDQLVPVNQAERMQAKLEEVQGLRVVRGHRAVGEHAAPWKEGYIIWDNVLDILKLLQGNA